MELYNEFQSIVLMPTSSIEVLSDTESLSSFLGVWFWFSWQFFINWYGPAGDDMTRIVEAGWQR